MGVFHVSWATRSPFVALATFFALHVSILWPWFGSGHVSDYEYMALYPLVAALAALAGYLFSLRVAGCAAIDWFCAPRSDCAHLAQWRHVAKHAALLGLVIAGPSLVLELYTSNTFVGGLVSLAACILAHAIYWSATRNDDIAGALCCGASGYGCRPTVAYFACWFIDFGVLRLGYTVTHMLWPDYRLTHWPFYTLLAELFLVLVPFMLVLEFGVLRRSACGARAGACPSECCAPCAPTAAIVVTAEPPQCAFGRIDAARPRGPAPYDDAMAARAAAEQRAVAERRAYDATGGAAPDYGAGGVVLGPQGAMPRPTMGTAAQGGRYYEPAPPRDFTQDDIEAMEFEV